MVDGTQLNSVLEFIISEALYQIKGALTMTYTGGWPMLVHISLRQKVWNNHHVSMQVKGKIYRESCCPPSYTEPRPGQCTELR